MSDDLKTKALDELAKAEAEAERQRQILKSMENPWVEVACKLHVIFCSRWCDHGDWGTGCFSLDATQYNASHSSREVYGRYHRAATEILDYYCANKESALDAVEAVARAVRNEEDKKKMERYIR